MQTASHTDKLLMDFLSSADWKKKNNQFEVMNCNMLEVIGLVRKRVLIQKYQYYYSPGGLYIDRTKSELPNDLIVYCFIYHHVCPTLGPQNRWAFAFLPETQVPCYVLTAIYIQREKA